MSCNNSPRTQLFDSIQGSYLLNVQKINANSKHIEKDLFLKAFPELAEKVSDVVGGLDCLEISFASILDATHAEKQIRTRLEEFSSKKFGKLISTALYADVLEISHQALRRCS